jgi:hypothetical protein
VRRAAMPVSVLPRSLHRGLSAGGNAISLTEPLPKHSPMRAGLLTLREIIRLLSELLRRSDVRVYEISAAVSRGVGEALRQLTMMHWTRTHIGYPPAQQLEQRHVDCTA